MTIIATLGPEGSLNWEAAHRYKPNAELKIFSNLNGVINAFVQGRADLAVIPAYNTREGESKEFFRAMAMLDPGVWIDNLMMPVHLSLGAVDTSSRLELIMGDAQHLKQCSEYLAENFPDATLMAIQKLDQEVASLKEQNILTRGVIARETRLTGLGLTVREREVAPYNRTRYAVLGRSPLAASGYDATALMTFPLKDRVGLLYDILGEFTRRGISLQDLRTENDLKTQKLMFYVEAEGHIDDPSMQQAIQRIENTIIQEPGAFRLLGSFPRIDLRTKLIRTVGFIGTGAMSQWFANRLQGEGYQVTLTGRNSETKPEEMIPGTDLIIVCVPISVTAETIRRYGPLLSDKQALIIMAGEAENTLAAALETCAPGVETMLVHNLWGPQAATMKDKNVSVVKTRSSGVLCSEFESFLYKHGAIISRDTPVAHDLLMGVSQKLPTAISTAMAMALKDNGIKPEDIGSHSTLTSLYGILAMSRVHAQNPRTYGEILSTEGAGRKIVRDFIRNLSSIMDLADRKEIDPLVSILEESRQYLTEEFLKNRMQQALAVDETLGKIILS
ncbi:MAG: prephenate dehydrogenase/arogenate dehydrogenase family protein [Proteobacteria bacterium]|nr:prephenate dehydrogenase/arogenate dehydrogenase family protein [Pseudomonadota bacterium]MBU1688805.1 prephenate dehydrogenase/arogenate dehydrogenase family protein [Pseudomonadota bacterium]